VLPQVRVAASAPVVECVTLFCPLRAGEEAPAFACRRVGDGAVEIRCERAGAASVLSAAAATRGPLHRPTPVSIAIVSARGKSVSVAGQKKE
jgi:hypothetical protein